MLYLALSTLNRADLPTRRAQKSPYLPSQYSLFNGITAATMEVIERGSIRRERQEERGEEEEGSNLEEVLVSFRRARRAGLSWEEADDFRDVQHFLSDPPLPF